MWLAGLTPAAASWHYCDWSIEMRETPYDPIFMAAGAEFGVDPALLKAIGCHESEFAWISHREEPAFYRRYIVGNPDWQGHRYYGHPEIIAASWGIMQIMFVTACESGGFSRDGTPWDLMQPETNIRAGACHLAKLLDRYHGKTEDAVSAYNAGMARWDAARRRYVNQGYVTHVMSLLAEEKTHPTPL
jgi:soluble lytic murein transglycosylase-like protein